MLNLQIESKTYMGLYGMNPQLSKTPKILIIDDDTNFLFGVSRVLMKADFEVIAATDSTIGLRKAQVDRPDLILLDVNMPKMSGFQVKKALDSDPATKSIPVVFLTAMNDRIHILSGLNMAEDYIAKPVDPDILVARLKSVLKRLETGYQMALRDSQKNMHLGEVPSWWQMVEIHDLGTAGHTIRVAEWASVLAQSLGIEGEMLEHIKKRAMLHDVGKIAISDHILNKPGPLDEEEWKIMREHPKIGYEMLINIDFLRSALDIVRYHHERWDGQGYPDKLQGEAIPLAARIFTIVDVFDALLSKRPYKNEMSESQAIEILKEQRGKQFDPQLVDHFLSNFARIKEAIHESKDSSGH